MSDTHAHTAKVQADVQTGKPHIPPGHVEAEQPEERLDDRQSKPMMPYIVAGALVIAAIAAAVILMV